MFENARSLIEKYSRIIIHRHGNPDGDAIGSQVGMKQLILANYPNKEVYAVGDAAGRYAFVPGSEPDEVPDAFYAGALAIILDTSAKALISDGRYTMAEATLRIDHHIFCEKIADVEVVDTTFESCCGLVTAAAEECGWKIPPIAARALFVGMVTDSGRFRYDSVTPRTYRLAALLTEQDFSPAEVSSELYADDFEMVKLRASFVLKIHFTEHGVAYIYNTREEAASYGVSPMGRVEL